jgi:hypothetical protein
MASLIVHNLNDSDSEGEIADSRSSDNTSNSSKKRGKGKVYDLLHTYESSNEALNWLNSERIWTEYGMAKKTTDGMKQFYKCRNSTRKEICEASMCFPTQKFQ